MNLTEIKSISERQKQVLLTAADRHAEDWPDTLPAHRRIMAVLPADAWNTADTQTVSLDGGARSAADHFIHEQGELVDVQFSRSRAHQDTIYSIAMGRKSAEQTLSLWKTKTAHAEMVNIIGQPDLTLPEFRAAGIASDKEQSPAVLKQLAGDLEAAGLCLVMQATLPPFTKALQLTKAGRRAARALQLLSGQKSSRALIEAWTPKLITCPSCREQYLRTSPRYQAGVQVTGIMVEPHGVADKARWTPRFTDADAGRDAVFCFNDHMILNMNSQFDDAVLSPFPVDEIKKLRDAKLAALDNEVESKMLLL